MSCLERDGPVPNGFGTTSPRTCSYTISIPLAIAGSHPGAGWPPALLKTYRNLPFLPVTSWSPGKKTNVIDITSADYKLVHILSLHHSPLECSSILHRFYLLWHNSAMVFAKWYMPHSKY